MSAAVLRFMPAPVLAPADARGSGSMALSPVTRRRLAAFSANRRAVWSLWIFLVLFALSLVSELIANDRPVLASYKGQLLFPAVINYPESTFGGFLAETVYRDPFIAEEIEANGWMLWPPVRFSYRTVDTDLPTASPSKPSWLFDTATRCSAYPLGVDDPGCNLGNFHWLGTDNQGRDVLARALYGFRISVLFGLTLTIISSAIGILVGALQGFVGGWFDLVGQRLIEIWSSLPSLYLLLILSSVIVPSFWSLLIILLLFSWMTLVGVVRAESLRARNFEYVEAARALGVSNRRILFRHLLPNAMVATVTFMPFILSGSVTTLTSLDFLGYGLPVGTPSLGELLSQGKEYLQSPWLGITGFAVVTVILVLVVFVGEGVRDAFDSRKVLR